MKNYRTPFILFAVCALAFGPLCVEFFGSEWRAKWMLAWAANQLQNKQFEAAEKTLQCATEMSDNLATDPEFWKLKFDLVLNKKDTGPEVYSELFQEAMVHIPKLPAALQASLAHDVGGLLHQCNQNQLAVDIMEKFFPPISQRTPSENNSIAYFRSKIRKGLETALLEIDAALVKDGTSEAAFLDTKAWVLHGLSRNELALDFVQAAIQKQSEAIGELKGMAREDRVEFKKWLFDDSSSLQVDAVQKSNAMAELKKRFSGYPPEAIEAFARGVASLRFHRASILDELGRSDESEPDYAWLDRFGLEQTDKLN